MTYKRFETCIKHLQSDMKFKFHDKKFNLFRNNEEVALQAIKEDHGAFQYIGDELKTNEFTYKALEVNPDVYLLARNNSELANDKKFKKLSAKCDRFLYFENDEVKDNKELVLISVERHAGSIVFASSRLKDDEEVVLEAVKLHPIAMNFASQRLQKLCKDKDPEKVLESIIFHNNLQSNLSNKNHVSKNKSKDNVGKI